MKSVLPETGYNIFKALINLEKTNKLLLNKYYITL